MKKRSKATQRYLDEIAERKAGAASRRKPKAKTRVKQAQQHSQFSAEDVRRVKEVLSDEVKRSTIDPDTLQLIMAMAREMAIELRKPTPEEEERRKAENEKHLQNRLQAAEDGKRLKEAISQQQQMCTHTKPNGDHTFRGQVHSDGWAIIRCVRCFLPFRVRPLPSQVQQGLNLWQVKGLTAEHLKRWQDQSPVIDQKIRETEATMSRMSQELADAQLQV